MAVEVVKIQRQVRGYLARKRYVAMKDNATTIQSAFRGYRVRREYSKLRRGMVQLQAQYRDAVRHDVKDRFLRRCDCPNPKKFPRRPI